MTALAQVTTFTDTAPATRETLNTTIAALGLVAFVAMAGAGLAYAGLGQVRFAPALAKELIETSALRSAAGDHAGAVAASRKAVDTYRGLMRKSNIHYAPQLATSLHNLSEHLNLGGDHAGALAAIEEAVQIRRQLAKSNPGRYAASLAQSAELRERIEITKDRSRG